MEGYSLTSSVKEHPFFPADRPHLSIIVPTFQEAANLRLLVAEISAVIEQVTPFWELIIVDDNSQDGSVEVCEALRTAGVPLRLIVRTNARGLSSAVVEGFVHARAPVLVVMDADLSHPATAIPYLYHAILEGAEFAIGSRYVPGGGTDDHWNTYRWLNSKVASLLAKPLVSLQDPTAGFFALPQSLLQRCERLNPIGYKIALEVLIKSKATNVREIPIHFRTRQFGKSKLKLKQQLLYLRHLYSLYKFKFFQSSTRLPTTDMFLSPQPSQFSSKEKVS
jgi:dolichol-phosphate mannosyltransferase